MFWILTFSYWLHLLSTVVWLGALAVSVLAAVPALRQQTLQDNQWVALQKRLMPWIQVSLVILLVTGFFQMTNDPHYGGFLVLDGLWAWAMLLKHVAFGGMVAITLYVQFALYPEMGRVALLAAKKPEMSQREQARLHGRETHLLWLNVACAAVVLFFTAVMTAV